MVCFSEIIFHDKIMVFVCFWRDKKISARRFRLSVRILELKICLLFRINCLQKINGECSFLGVKESFLPDFKFFLWGYSKLKFSQKKRQIVMQLTTMPTACANKKTVPPIFCEILNIQQSCRKFSANPKNWQPPSFRLKCIFVAYINWPILDS